MIQQMKSALGIVESSAPYEHEFSPGAELPMNRKKPWNMDHRRGITTVGKITKCWE